MGGVDQPIAAPMRTPGVVVPGSSTRFGDGKIMPVIDPAHMPGDAYPYAESTYPTSNGKLVLGPLSHPWQYGGTFNHPGTALEAYGPKCESLFSLPRSLAHLTLMQRLFWFDADGGPNSGPAAFLYPQFSPEAAPAAPAAAGF